MKNKEKPVNANLPKKKKKLNKEGSAALFMLIPCVLFLVVCSIYPIVWTFQWIPYNYDGTRSFYIGWGNIETLFKDKAFWGSVGVTLEYAFWKIVLVIPFSLLITILLQQKLRLSNFFRGVYFMPTIIASAISGMIFTFIFATKNGILNAALIAIGLVPQESPIKWLMSADWVMVAVMTLSVWGGFGNYMLYFTAGMAAIDTEMYEAAKIDGANGVQIFFRITIPMLSPTLKIVLQLALLSAFRDYEAIMILSQGGPQNRSMTMFLYNYYMIFGNSEAGTSAQVGYGAVCSIMAAIIVGAVTAIYLVASRKLDDVV